MYHTPTFCRGRPHSTRKLVARQKIDWRTLVPYTRRLGARGVAGVAPERGFSTGPYTIETKFGAGRGAAEHLPVQGEVSIGFDGAVCFRAGAEEKKKFWCKVSCSIDAPQAGLHIACGFAPGGGEFVRPLHSSHIRVLGPRKSLGGTWYV